MKESSKDKEENKNKQTKYQLQEFNESEEDNFKTLNDMIKKMITINDSKIFFKQLGQFLGGLYNIALNREKLTGIKGFREQWKSDKKGVKGVKTSIDKFLKIPVKTETSAISLVNLIKYIKKEVSRGSSKLLTLKNNYENFWKAIPEITRYTDLPKILESDKTITIKGLNQPAGEFSYFKTYFNSGYEPFPPYNTGYETTLNAVLEQGGAKNFQQIWLDGTSYVRNEILKSIRNPNLRLYNPDLEDKKQEKQKNVEDDRETYGSHGETISQLMAELNGNLRTIADLNTEQANSRNTYIPFGKFLGRLYYVCEKSRGLRSIFSSSKKGASGAVTYIKKFLNTQGGSEKCATALDDLMEFLLGNNGIRLSSSRLCNISESNLGSSWIKIKIAVVNSINKDKVIEKLIENFEELENDKQLKDLIDVYKHNSTSDDSWTNAYGSGYYHGDQYLVFYRKNFLAPAKIKMAKIVQRECLSTYNKIKIENK